MASFNPTNPPNWDTVHNLFINMVNATLPLKTDTPEGDQWLKAALDPFHDYLLTVSGLPDQEIGNTCVQVFKKKVSITKPKKLDPESTWDCHIAALPIMYGAPMPIGGEALFPSNAGAGFMQAAKWNVGGSATAPTLGTVVVNKVTSGSPTWPHPNPVIGQQGMDWTDDVTFESDSYDAIDPRSATAMARLIAGGFEVHNDTAEIYKQGASTTYTMPQSAFHAVQAFSVVGDASGFGELATFRMPPTTLEDAALIPNSVAMSAAQGVLAPFVMDVSHNPFELNQPRIPAAVYKDAAVSYVLTPDGELPPNTVVMSNTFNNGRDGELRQSDYRTAHIETTGYYASGLSSQTVLTLDLTFVVELRPTPANPTLLSLASPSCPFDAAALAAYTSIRKSLPPGVPVDMNAKGDWFRMIAKVAREIAPHIPHAISVVNPQAGRVAQLVYDVAQMSTGSSKKTKKTAGPTNAKPIGNTLSNTSASMRKRK